MTWENCQTSASSQQWRSTCTASTCVIQVWRSPTLASPRDAGGRLTSFAALWTVLWLHNVCSLFNWQLCTAPSHKVWQSWAILILGTWWSSLLYQRKWYNSFVESNKAQLQQKWNDLVWQFVHCWSWVLMDFISPEHSPQCHALWDDYYFCWYSFSFNLTLFSFTSYALSRFLHPLLFLSHSYSFNTPVLPPHGFWHCLPPWRM